MPNEIFLGMPDNMPVHLNEIDFPLTKPDDIDIVMLQDALMRMLNEHFDYSTCSAFIGRLIGVYDAVISDVEALNIVLNAEGIIQSGYLLGTLETEITESIENCEKVIGLLDKLAEDFISKIAVQMDILEDLAQQIKHEKMMANAEMTRLKATFLMVKVHKPN